MRRKILLINWQDWTNPLAGGAEVHLKNIFTRLTDFFDITLLCSNFTGAKCEEILDGIRITRVGSRNTFNFFVPSAYRKLSRKTDFDLVIEDLNKIPFYGKFYIHEPRIAIMHHLFKQIIFSEANPVSGAYVYFAERLIPLFYRDIPFISVSESTKEDLIELGIEAEKISVIYNGVNFESYKYSESKYENPTIVCLGRIKRYKRIDILIGSFKLLMDKLSNVKLIVVGDGDDLSRLKKIVRELKMEDSVEFKGFVSEEDKKRMLSRSWVAVNTSPKEGWGLTSIEAQASGTPSVVPDSPGLRETVKDGRSGYIYNFGDKVELVSILKELLSDRKRAERMGESAREWASNFSWDKSAEKFRDFIIDYIS